MDPQELVPLESGLPKQPRPIVGRHCSRIASQSCIQGPLRLCRMLLLMILLPSSFIFVPLYLRYRVYQGQMYPMSMTDMRLIDGKISTTWCQRQVVRSNTTFNAFVVPGPPEFSQELVPVSMTRQLELEDDMKEYWGFYLLKGSSVTVSTCVRWPGASLIMIKGYKHLKECAYIGDDSSEEVDELKEAYKLGLLTDTELQAKLLQLNKVDGKANVPEAMKRHKAGVSFHDPNNVANITSPDTVPTVDVTDHDPKELREILERLHALRETAKKEAQKYYKPPENIITVPELHRYRDTNVDIHEREHFKFNGIEGKNNEEDNIKLYQSRFIESKFTTNKPTTTTEKAVIQTSTTEKHETLTTVINEVKKANTIREETTEGLKVIATVYTTEFQTFDSASKATEEGYFPTSSSSILVPTLGSSQASSNSNPISEEPNSREVFEDVLKRLQALGDRGKRVLTKLQDTLGVENHQPNMDAQATPDIMSRITGSSAELDRLRQVLVEAIDEEKTKYQRQQKRRDARDAARAKRELMLGQIELTKTFNEDDEARDYAAEEGLQPDGYAEHHDLVNETTAFDMSNSEYWSSFSSSEEALLECDGLILNLPLTPSAHCVAGASDQDTIGAARSNALTYRVPANGYYFFVFNSENEVQTNFIKAKFDLQKTRYDVARTALRECKNSTERCDLNLDIFSSQKVVLEVPLRNNESLWNEQFVIISECEPRTSVYLVCVIAVPILIVVFAFQ